MKHRLAGQIHLSVAYIDQIAALTRRISQNGLLQQIASALTAVFSTEQTAGKMTTEDLRHCLKAITAQIVEDIGKRRSLGIARRLQVQGYPAKRFYD